MCGAIPLPCPIIIIWYISREKDGAWKNIFLGSGDRGRKRKENRPQRVGAEKSGVIFCVVD
jgi:hypothetical protein